MTQEKSVSLLITSGNGPAECRQAVAGILERMCEAADGQGIALDISAIAAKHGPKSAVILVHGPQASTFAHAWEGTIQWVARSQLRPNHKRQNWFIGVSRLARLDQKTELQFSDIRFDSFRAGGPGGQHQNTTDSAVRATHLPTGVTAVAREMRSQHRNKSLAMERLQLVLDAQFAADISERKALDNKRHNTLERGNPVRRFKGTKFRELRGKA